MSSRDLLGVVVVASVCDCDSRLHLSDVTTADTTLCGLADRSRFVTDIELITCDDCLAQRVVDRLLVSDDSRR